MADIYVHESKFSWLRRHSVKGLLRERCTQRNDARLEQQRIPR